jgi:hypothetical protein
VKAIFLDGPLKGQETEVLESVSRHEEVTLDDGWIHLYRISYPDRDGARQLGYDHSWRIIGGEKQVKKLGRVKRERN